MGTQAPSVYQQVIEKTKGIMSRTQELARNIEKKLNVDKMGYDGVRTTNNILIFLTVRVLQALFVWGFFFIMGGMLVNIQMIVQFFFFVQFSLLFCAT